MTHTSKSKPVAADIYERQEFDREGMGGDVQNDIADLLDDGDMMGLEDYFGDEDPIAWL